MAIITHNTIAQFRAFLLDFVLPTSNPLQFMLISSQATSGEVEGSETRVYDPERVMKLHERLGRSETYLLKINRKVSSL